MVGEILKLAIVVTLVAVLAMGVYSLLPDERPPHIEIEMRYNATNSSQIDLTHVGGDPVPVADVWIEIMNTSDIFDKKDYQLSQLAHPNQTFWKFSETLQVNASTGKVNATGQRINLSEAKVSVVHLRTVIAIGEVHKP